MRLVIIASPTFIFINECPEEDPKYTELYFKQYAFKTMANSFYGILGAPFTRYFKSENAVVDEKYEQVVVVHVDKLGVY